MGRWYRTGKIKNEEIIFSYCDYYWIFDKVYDDDHFEADLNDEENEYVRQYMLEEIKQFINRPSSDP